MESRQHEVNYAADNTCGWLLEHEKFKEWLYQNRGLLWIAGKPGAGKSTLLKYALQNIAQIEPAARVLLISFFFHGRGTELQKTPLGLFRSILHQLLEKAPGLLSNLVQHFKNKRNTKGTPGEDWDWHLAELEDIIKASLPKVLGKYSIRIFVDALDECQEEAAIEVVEKLRNLISKAPPTCSMFSICFTCRQYPIPAPDRIPKIIVQDENNNDITTYVQQELRNLDTKGQLGNAIIIRAQGVFQWAFLVIKQVYKLESEGKTEKQIKTVIQQTPPQLHKLYQELLAGISQQEKPTSLSCLRSYRVRSPTACTCWRQVNRTLAQYVAVSQTKIVPWSCNYSASTSPCPSPRACLSLLMAWVDTITAS